MAKEIDVLIEVRVGRIRTALLEGGRLTELIVDDENRPSLVGNIYLGRVEKVVEPLNAAFIDLGLERSGFLALAEVRPAGTKGNSKDSITNFICEGDKIVVQVQRDPFEDKGPKLTARITLTARTAILTPGDRAVRLSRRIEDGEIRDRLAAKFDDEARSEEGFIVRTAALGATDENISADIEILREAFLELEAGRDTGKPPELLLKEPDGVIHALRDLVPVDVGKIVIDETKAYLKAKAYLEKQAPGLLDRLVHYNDGRPLFEDEELAEDLERALAAKVPLPSGGDVIFSETPALVAIDVNAAGTAKGGREASAFQSNLEAAKEIARQIRLRNLSGLLVIDFISMKNRDNGAKLLKVLKQAVAPDHNQVFVGGFTRFGLVEMTRRRTHPSLAASLGAQSQVCSGVGTGLSAESTAYKALDRFAMEADCAPSQGIELRVGEKVAQALEGPVKGALKASEERLGRKINIVVETHKADDEYEITGVERGEKHG